MLPLPRRARHHPEEQFHAFSPPRRGLLGLGSSLQRHLWVKIVLLGPQSRSSGLWIEGGGFPLELRVLPFFAFSIDCAGILKLRNSDIELRKGETDIGRKNTRVRLVFRVHVPQGSGKVVSVQTASVPIECCEQRGPMPFLCLL